MVIVNFFINDISFSKEGYIFIKGVYFKVPKNWKEKMNELIENLFKSSFFDIFDSNGSYLLRQEIPGFVWGFSFDSKGFLYMIKQEEEYWRVVKYKVEFK